MLETLLLAASCAALPPLPLPAEDQRLTRGVEALLDPERRISLTDVYRAPACNQFVRQTHMPNFGARDSGVWLRFRPSFDKLGTGVDDHRRDWRLVVRFAGLQKVCAYFPLRDGGVTTDCVEHGNASARERWAGGRLVFAIPATLSPDQPVHVYAESRLWLKAPLEIATVEALAARETRSEYRWGLYYGVLVLLVLMSLTTWFGRNDRAFLYYALHIGTLTVALAAWQGRFAQWDPGAFSLTRITPLACALFLALGSRFYAEYFGDRRYAPSVHRVLDICFVLSLLVIVLGLFAPIAGVRASGPLTLAWLGTVLYGSAVRVRQGYTPAGWVIAGMSVLLFAVFLNAMAVIGILLTDPYLTVGLAYVGNLVAAAFLLLGLGYRTRLLATERDRARETAMASQQLALHRAHYDGLTSLPKRTRFREELQDRLARNGGSAHWAVITLGVDPIRPLYHALGHEGGDKVLMEMAERLSRTLQPDEVLARLGAAIFGVLTEVSDDGMAALEARCADWCNVLAKPLLSGRGATLGASAGIALSTHHGNNAEMLVRYSDEAYCRARDRGVSSSVEVFNPQLHQSAERFLELNKGLRHALAHDELELHFQPMRAFDSAAFGGVEALLRWRHRGEDVSPERFIAIAERSDLMGALTDWVFRRACRHLAEWRRQGAEIPYVSVNVPATQFRLPGFVERVSRALAESQLQGDSLMLEITETILLEDLAAAASTLEELHALGIGVAVDDFGVGYSSLSYLRRLPVQCVKIDKSFLHGIPHEPEAVSVINAVITLCRDLRLTVIVEGVETQEQYDFLAERGAAIAQGYLIAKPMPAGEVGEWFAQRKRA